MYFAFRAWWTQAYNAREKLLWIYICLYHIRSADVFSPATLLAKHDWSMWSRRYCEILSRGIMPLRKADRSIWIFNIKGVLDARCERRHHILELWVMASIPTLDKVYVHIKHRAELCIKPRLWLCRKLFNLLRETRTPVASTFSGSNAFGVTFNHRQFTSLRRVTDRLYAGNEWGMSKHDIELKFR